MLTHTRKTQLRVRRQTWITRDDLRSNRDVLYVYGDNVEGEGRRGLAREMRGEPNAHAISISWGPFDPFTPLTAADAKTRIDQDIQALLAREASYVIWPMTGIVPEFMTMPDDIYTHLRQQARRILKLADPV